MTFIGRAGYGGRAGLGLILWHWSPPGTLQPRAVAETLGGGRTVWLLIPMRPAAELVEGAAGATTCDLG